ncbi:MAG: carboxypeptidase regulatory-like domain-containing protein [Bacteroidetes bacterium]|nr:MAG: carboxypeptidase regulatory-like domain-containing protein [Bacteroidota bacterium]
MKSTKLKIAAIAMVVAFGLFAFRTFSPGAIKGTVTPTAAAVSAMAISGTDTSKVLIDNGSFAIKELKAGTYKLVIEAVPPYKNFEKEGIEVADSKATDVGEISLQK